jgi:hypothetical protein
LFVTFAHVCPRPSLRLHAEMPPEDFVMRISSHGGGGTNENIDAFEMATLGGSHRARFSLADEAGTHRGDRVSGHVLGRRRRPCGPCRSLNEYCLLQRASVRGRTGAEQLRERSAPGDRNQDVLFAVLADFPWRRVRALSLSATRSVPDGPVGQSAAPPHKDGAVLASHHACRAAA